MITLLVVFFFVIWLLIRKWKRRHFDRLYEQLKISTPRLPFIGHAYIMLRSQEDIMTKLQYLGREATRAGGISGFWIAQKLYISVADPKVAEIILKTCLEKDDMTKCFHLALGDGSIFAPVKTWRPRRKQLAPTFSMTNLNNLVENFYMQSCVLVENLHGATGKGPISMWKMYSLYSMDAILGSLGVEVSAQKNAIHPFLVATEEVLNALTARIWRPWLYSDFIYKLLPCYHTLLKHKPIIYGFLDKIIKKKREQNESYHVDLKRGTVRDRSKMFIDLMIESGNMNDVAVREESMVIIAAASDTSAVALGFISVMLARYPEVQDKVYQEIKEVIGDVGRPVMAEDLPLLKYLDAVIRETLRLYPSVPIVVRQIDKEIELPSGVTLLPGCGAFINIWAINRNPTYWGEDAEQFRPERFLEATPRHPAAFATFSHGPRNCLGFQYAMMSIKTVLATLLRPYRLMPAPNDTGLEPLRVKFDVMMRHVDNYNVRIEPRK